MSTTCVGSVLKYNICLSHIPNGLTMDDIDFTAHFYMVAGKEYVVSKSEMTRVDANNYIANVDTSVTGSGSSMKCRIDNLIPDGSWKDVCVSSNGMYQTAVLDGGYIYRSSDYGITWSQVGLSKNWRSVAMSSNGKYQTAVLSEGTVYVSSDYGVTWSAVYITSAVWCSVRVSADGKYQCAVPEGSIGIFIESSDYGVTWKEYSSAVKYIVQIAMNR